DDVPLELLHIVARMTAKNPAERFQSPQEVIASLKQIAAATESVSTDSVTAVQTPVVPLSQTSFAKFSLGGALLLALMLIGGIVLNGFGPDSLSKQSHVDLSAELTAIQIALGEQFSVEHRSEDEIQVTLIRGDGPFDLSKLATIESEKDVVFSTVGQKINKSSFDPNVFEQLTKIKWVELHDCRLSDISWLGRLPDLQKLVLHDCELNDNFPVLKNIRTLYVFLTNATDDNIASIPKGSLIESLVVESPSVTNRSLERIANFKNLRYLGLRDDPRVTAEGLATLSGHKTLERIEIRSKDLDSVAPFLGMPKLEELDLEGSSIDDEDLREIATMKNIRRLNINNTQVTIEGVNKHLWKMESLESVKFRHRRIIYHPRNSAAP
ncbi:MAG: hypothetical protein AAF497_21650, partial [Planctomycetota bacterium]